jgi:hypothetical protein
LHVDDHAQLAWFYSAPVAGNCSAVDTGGAFDCRVRRGATGANAERDMDDFIANQPFVADFDAQGVEERMPRPPEPGMSQKN